jgi:molecular chaperone GrpE
MPDQESEAGKNQNEQSSADQIGAEDNIAHGAPAVVDTDELESHVIDIDGGSDSLEDLMQKINRFVGKKKPEHAATATVADIPVVIPVDEVAVLKTQIEQEKNNTLRALADLQNLRRRTDEERLRIIREGNERLIKQLLPILDDFERGLNASRDTQSYEQLIVGVDSVLRKAADILAQQGVQPIPAVGEPFNPDLHEAVQVVEAADLPDESIVQELQRGYTLHGRVIRPSLVSVAKS